MFLPDNLKYLRNHHGFSQQALADRLELGRSTLAEYERGKTQPTIDNLVRLSEIFQVSLDDLIRKNLQKEAYEILRNRDLRVLAITVDRENRGNIELVDTRAEAGYLDSYQDPEYIRELPKIYFPRIPEGTFRGFEIQGESMLPMESGSVVICSYVEQIAHLRDGRTYVIVTHREGLVYKRVRINRQRQTLTLLSDNELYAPYEVAWEDIREIWEYYAHLSFSDSRVAARNLVEERLLDIQQKVTFIREKLADPEA